MEDPQEEKQQLDDECFGYQNMGQQDVDMKEISDDEAKAEEICNQIEKLCKYLKIDYKETPKDPLFDLEMRLDKLQCKKTLVQAFRGKSQSDDIETPNKRQKGPSSFHSAFITEEQHESNVITPQPVLRGRGHAEAKTEWNEEEKKDENLIEDARLQQRCDTIVP